MRLAVAGHVEWVDFARVERLPAAGEIVAAVEAWEAPAGGGAMAAFALLSLNGGATFFCGVGEGELAARTVAGLRSRGLDVRAGVRSGRAQSRTLTHLDAAGERTITVLAPPLVPHGEDPLGWELLEAYDGVFLLAGDAAAARACRAAKVMVSTGRARGALLEAGVSVDALVGSAEDLAETVDDALLAAAAPRWVVTTEGERGGRWSGADGSSGRWAAAPLPGAPTDAFGCGDSFAAALTAGLADGRSIADACALAARVGAAVRCERAPSVGALASLW